MNMTKKKADGSRLNSRQRHLHISRKALPCRDLASWDMGCISALTYAPAREFDEDIFKRSMSDLLYRVTAGIAD